MSGDEIKGVVRAVVPALLVWAASKGWITADTNVAELGAAIVTVFAAAWSIVSKRKDA